jgi:hypothetical protein
MFAITRITGQVGGGVARTLLDARKSVRGGSAERKNAMQSSCLKEKIAQL